MKAVRFDQYGAVDVIGSVDTRSSHAEYVVVAAANLTPKPAIVPWEVTASRTTHGSQRTASSR